MLSNPYQTHEITPEMKQQFVEAIYAGHKANTAAAEIGTTGTVMRRLKRRGGVHYDAEFARAWAEAEDSDEHRRNNEDELRALIDERSRTSDPVLIKRAMVELPEWSALRQQDFHHTHELQILARRLPALTEEELNRAIEAEEAQRLERGELKLLPAPKTEDDAA